MKNKTYADLLKDPRWQRKRLDILNRKNFSCQECAAKTETLHIHHCFYERGLNPWEYPDYAYKCLCADCHATRADLELSLKKVLSNLSAEELDFLRCDVVHAIVIHGTKKVSSFCRSLDK